MTQFELQTLQNNILSFETNIDIAIADATNVIEEYNSKNSKRAFESDINYWKDWCQIVGIHIFDQIKKEHIILFIMQHCEKHKISTIERRLASLSRFLHLNRLQNPCKDKDILVLLKKLTEKYGCSKSWGKAITVSVLNDLLKTCENDLLGIRDYALLLFGFSTGGRRRSEISNSVLENLIRCADGNFLYNLGKSKTNQIGDVDQKPIVGRAAIALLRWLEVSGIKEGHIFRSLKKGCKDILPRGICDKQVSRIIKSRCLKAGYNPSEYTAHSLRSGFVTEGGKCGKAIGDVMALTGHRSISTVMRYYQTGAVLNNSAAYLAG